MKPMCYVCLYLSYLEAMEYLSDAELGQVIRSLLEYAKTGEKKKLSGLQGAMLTWMTGQHDRDRERYDKRCEVNRANGKKGGRPRKEPLPM
ncbi:MAG: hypothetical protein IJB17_04090 [Oscillospiraceae bacterium]|nr:hypothetical protein [Oscillospiraceae bacterium]